MNARKMTSKKAGTCISCGGAILPGMQIFWSRGRGAWHTNCQTAKYLASQCTNCQGSGRMWNNAPCKQCDGTGARTVQQFQGHPTH